MITLDLAIFRARFPKFSDINAYPDIAIQAQFNTAIAFMSNEPNCFLAVGAQEEALYLLTAHLLYISSMIAAGTPVQVMVSAAEGTVNAGFAPPPFKNGFQFWLTSTPYGSMLWALLQIHSVGGAFVAGTRSRSGIRKPQGYF